MYKNCVLGKFCVGVRYFHNFALFRKLFYTKDCVTVESVFVTFENCLLLKTALHFKFAFSGETVLLRKIALLENCVTLKNFALGFVTFLKS